MLPEKEVRVNRISHPDWVKPKYENSFCYKLLVDINASLLSTQNEIFKYFLKKKQIFNSV